jgi:hypothetical protein
LQFNIENFVIGTQTKYSNATYLYIETTAFALAARLISIAYKNNNQLIWGSAKTVNYELDGDFPSYSLSCQFYADGVYLTKYSTSSLNASTSGQVNIDTATIHTLYSATNKTRLSTIWTLTTYDANGSSVGESTITGEDAFLSSTPSFMQAPK